MSRTLQWVLGISAGLIALAIVLAVVGPWVASWLGWQGRYGMSGARVGARYGMMGGNFGMMGGFGSPQSGAGGFGMMGGRYGMMQGPLSGAAAPWAEPQGDDGSAGRITLDQARELAEDYVAAVGPDLAVVEVMEFENNFYAVVEESDTGRGAFELLVDPYTGAVGAEPGPNMMWNDRYGHMGFGRGGDNRLSMDEARDFAQQTLDTQLPGSRVHDEGASFYGYYTFDFDGSDGSIAGMLSVEGSSGDVWLHTWHGEFVSEWEAEETSS